MVSFCQYADPVDPASDPYVNEADTGLVSFCMEDGTQSFTWPLSTGAAIRVAVCPKHVRVLADLCEAAST